VRSRTAGVQFTVAEPPAPYSHDSHIGHQKTLTWQAAWLADDLPARFTERIFPIDHAIAEHWGELMAQSRRSGVALSVTDGFFAATALAKNLTPVTRNVKDFAPFGVPLFNPWEE
jgi:predicted nucleic acid-binding protein